MAQEKATITFSLEDDFSAQMAQIVGKLEDFKKRLDETSKAGTEGFRSVAEKVKQVGDHSAGANASLRSMSTYMREAFEGFNRSLAGSVSGLSKFEGMLTTMGPAIRGFASNFGRVGVAVGGVGAAAAAAAGGIWLLGRRLADQQVQMDQLTTKLGASEQAIVSLERAFSRFGKGPEAAHKALEQLQTLVEDTRKGAAAGYSQEIFKNIEGVGPQIEAAITKILVRIREGNLGKEEGMKLILSQIYGVQTSEEVRRKIADALKIPFEDLEGLMKNWPKVIKPTVLSEPMQEAMRRLNDVIHTEMEKISNAWTEGMNKLGPEGIERINAAIKEMGESIRALVPVIVDELGRALGDVNTIFKEIRAFFEWWNATPTEKFNQLLEGLKGHFTTPPLVKSLQRGAQQPAKPGDVVDPMSGAVMDTPQGTPQRFGGGADLSGLRINPQNWDKMMHDPANIALGRSRIEDRRGGTGEQGGQPIVLTRMEESQRESKDFLREIRDVMTWIRDQELAKQAKAGTGNGAGPPSQQGPPSAGTFGGGAGGGAAGGVPGAAGTPGGPAVGALSEVRQRFAKELQDPATMQLLMASTQAEVGGQGAQAQQAYMESVMNRAAARGKSLRETLTNAKYYPQSTISKLGRTFSGAQFSTMQQQAQAVLQGSNVSNFATGNESGGVRSGGAPVLFNPQTGERFVGENADLGWIRQMRERASSGAPGAAVQTPGVGVGGAPQMGQGDQKAPPTNLLEAAKHAAAMGGGPAVYQFMAAHGYPKAGNWCGEFAAAVVRSAGGTPPRNPEVASNWRNFGQQVATPQPGDIAVRRGVRTGSTGSHVTIVGGVQGGTFQGIGGNQRGGMISRFSTGTYDFFRPGGGLAGGKPLDAAAMAGGMGGGMAGGQPGGQGGLGAVLGGLGGGGGGMGGGGGVSGQATVTINVTVPAGAQVQSSASGSGSLANPTVTTNRSGQMSSAGQNARTQPNYYGNEY